MKTTIILALTLLFTSFGCMAAGTYSGLPPSDTLYFPVMNVTLVNQSPDPVMAGGVVTVRLSVQNTGAAEANNIVVGLDYKYPFSPVPGEAVNKTIYSLPRYPDEYSSAAFELRAKVDPNVTAGSYQLGILRGIASNEGGWEAGSDKITIRVTGEEFADISLNRTILVPGEVTPVSFTVTNTGNAPLENVVFSWSQADGVILPVSSDNTRQIKELGVGESVSLGYDLAAALDTTSGLYTLKIQMSYHVMDSNGDYASKTIERDVGVVVGGETDFDVTFAESSAGQTSLSVANVGNNPALAVTVRVPQQDGYRVDGSTASIVGNLDSGDYTVVSFQITQANASMFGGRNASFPAASNMPATGLATARAAARDSRLTVTIDYTDTTGQRHSVDKLVDIQYRSSALDSSRVRTASLLDYWWVVVLAILVLFAAIYLRRRGKPVAPVISVAVKRKG
jgi:hypothetical protein